ncbi:response regulator transcription factor [Croceibacterium sp. LX-88]|uniref:Response regulator transcription factor n=1 Tax=Croceibacterium selenioxidans TaxID=2838833 RepID=A0ABS5W366_9SPHN|nr:response regulator transcription factor [Croceibacterium selenioxidans]MBT2134193.1 response regulator transcription factor [Croceibacterium selenioxidans]
MQIKQPSADALRQVVHVVDDDAGMRASLENLFRSVGYHTRSYASVDEFLAADAEADPGCLVLDVRLPGTSGLDFQDQLREQDSLLPVVLMTGHGDIPMSVRAMKGGAIDFLAKPFREQDMLDAVSTALARNLSTRAASTQKADVQSRYETLSPREREVMAMVVAGRLNKQIAYDLSLSEITVKIHRGNAMRKMGARNLVDFVQIAASLSPAV